MRVLDLGLDLVPEMGLVMDLGWVPETVQETVLGWVQERVLVMDQG